MDDLHRQYINCRERLFNAPGDKAIRDEILVIGDVLESRGHAVGRRVALSEALHVERDRGTRAALRAELCSFTHVEARALFGPVAPLLEYRGALTIDWRGGAPIAARVDARHFTRLAAMEVDELVGLVVQAPVLQSIRRLWVRVRSADRAPAIVSVVADHRPRFALEELLVGANPRPSHIAQRSRFVSPTDPVQALAQEMPSLWLAAVSVARTTPLYPHEEAARWEMEAIRDELRELQGPWDASARAHLGRCLWAPEPELRQAAARMIARHGLVDAFAATLELLLRPGVCQQQDRIIDAIGGAGAPIAPVLARVAGSSGRYKRAEVRRAAGRALAAIRQKQRGPAVEIE